MGCIAEIVYGTVECNGNCDNCHWWDDPQKSEGKGMTRNAQDIIDDMRNIVKPRIAKMLLEANFEGYGKEDKAEFETEFEMTLTLAEKALSQEPALDKIRDEISAILTNSYDEGVKEKALQIIDKYR